MANNHMTPRSFLAKQIRRLREMTIDPKTGKAYTRAGLARAVQRSEDLIKSWELGRRVPQEDDLVLLEEIFDTKGVLLDLRKDLVKDERAPEWMDRWVEIEDDSTSLVEFEPNLIPGLLQTPEYARAVIMSSGRPVDDIETRIEKRMDRQEILTPHSDMMFVAVIDEGALYRPIGGPETMRKQLEKLLEIAKQQNSIIQVVPTEVGEYSGLAGGFIIATMNGREFAYVDDVLSGDVLEHPEEVAAVKRVWVTTQAEALPPNQSIEVIAKAVERWKT